MNTKWIYNVTICDKVSKLIKYTVWNNDINNFPDTNNLSEQRSRVLTIFSSIYYNSHKVFLT